MPLRSKRLDNCVRNRLAALLALGAKAMRMTIHTPSISLLLHERRARIKRISALRTEKVSGMPLSTTRHNNFAFDGRLARFAAWREHFVEVEMAEEALRLIGAIFVL
jgi:hypothetical protein